MQSTSISTNQQLVADRHAGYEGVAARGRLRKLARRSAAGATSEAFAARPTARFVGPRESVTPQTVTPQTAARKVA
jgi:hypothetical protein